MRKGNIQLAGVALLVVVLLVLLGGWLSKISSGDTTHAEIRRVFVIEMPRDLRHEDERPPVRFSHELHTNAVGDDCRTCHQQTPDGKSYIYRVHEAVAEQSADAIMDAYHDYCSSCHEERSRGPESCGECHVRQPDYAEAEWTTIDLDLRQHDKHVQFAEGDCGMCHHVYDEAAGKLVHGEDQEASCRDCHRGEEVEDTPSYRTVAHTTCVTCHLTLSKEERGAGPVDCDGCHGDMGELDPIADMSDVPRLDRAQEDMPLIQVDGNKLPGVPFNHVHHEDRTRNCRVCHHESLQACSDCHTLKGSPEGGGVKLADAFHHPESTHSCVGCHEREKATLGCNYCHSSLPRGPADSSCDTCHTGELPKTPNVRTLRKPETLLPADLPEEIEIGSLADTYAPVKFPHKKIVRSLNIFMGEHKLANVFHGDRPVVCSACHHHSPLGKPPPDCARCHQEPFDARILHRPGLYGAYHQQCIGCHRVMEIGDYRDCSVCHKDEKPMPGKPQGGPGAGETGGAK